MSEPQTAAQLLQQGLFHHRQGQIPEAMERYTEVLRINPDNGEALYYVAVVACQSGQYKEGAGLARKAIASGYDTAKVNNLLGQALDRLGEPLEAIKSLDRAIAIDPNLAEAHGNRANILVDADLPDEALKSFARALALNPNSPSDLLNRGALLQDLGRHAEALADYDKALAIVPRAPNILMNRANALAMLHRYAEAEAEYDTVIALAPKQHLAFLHKGLAAKQQGRFSDAQALMRQAVALEPKDATASSMLGQLLLLMGEWREGFALFESRANLKAPAFEALAEPRWNGEAPGDFRLVLVAEHEPADTLHMARYASLLAGRGYPVWLLAPETLAPLLRTLPGVERVVTTAGDLKADPRRILWLPLMSTPRLLHLTPKAIPAQAPYLTADPARTAQWAERLKGDGFKVGIAWQGSAGAAPLAALAPLSEIPGVRLISLQTQPAAAEIGNAPFAARIERVLNEADVSDDSLLDLAALIANLDLIVSVDSMPAHLAGALGKPVFTALAAVPDWRWLTRREDTPWYPSMRLFRQDDGGQWEPVFLRIADAIRGRLAGA
jgi:tetratricopeptide (TPR) repeat protein